MNINLDFDHAMQELVNKAGVPYGDIFDFRDADKAPILNAFMIFARPTSPDIQGRRIFSRQCFILIQTNVLMPLQIKIIDISSLSLISGYLLSFTITSIITKAAPVFPKDH